MNLCPMAILSARGTAAPAFWAAAALSIGHGNLGSGRAQPDQRNLKITGLPASFAPAQHTLHATTMPSGNRSHIPCEQKQLLVVMADYLLTTSNYKTLQEIPANVVC
jgi:hypothetical protein